MARHGEVDLGSVTVLYLPNCLSTELKVGDLDDILTDDISFSAHAGDTGDTAEFFIGMV